MKKFWIQFVVLFLVIMGALYFSYNDNAINSIVGNFQPLPPAETKVLKIGNAVINVEIADTQALRSQGLGGRESLASDSGMLFIFPETKKYQFWMKGLKFPLDFIWIQNGKVVDILKNIPAPTPGQSDQSLPLYESVVPVNQVLEVNAGFADFFGIRIGDPVIVQ